ncbi:hypothetical protein Barb7_01903 [Bacteroidales bacterium Barb7]|nr:hypothetical protein Barb7_01903 [Bacteroidales bacterium Barb7]
MVKALQSVFVFGETAFQILKGFDGKGEVVKPVLVNHCHVEKTVDDDDVGSVDVFGRKGELLDIVFARFGVVGNIGDAVRSCACEEGAVRVEGLEGCIDCRSVGRLFDGNVFFKGGKGFLGTPPMVFQRAATPFALKLRLALRHDLRIVEVERAVADGRLRGIGGFHAGAVDAVVFGLLLRQVGVLVG